MIKQMNRTNQSRAQLKNHHSLHRKQSPISQQQSRQDSIARPRKLSRTSLKENIPDIDKLISDIKIAPNNDKPDKTDYIKKIMVALKQLEKIEIVTDQIKTVTMLMQSIQKKIMSHSMAAKRRSSMKSLETGKNNPIDFKIYSDKNSQNSHKYMNSVNKSIKSQSILQNSESLNDVSPIKQMFDNTSRITYSNFSLKQLEKSIGKNKDKESNIITDKMKGDNQVKITVSQFEQSSELSGGTEQVSRLNDQIKYLQKLLAKKTMSQNASTHTTNTTHKGNPSFLKKCTGGLSLMNSNDLFRKHSNKY